MRCNKNFASYYLKTEYFLIPATLIAQPPDEPSKPVTPYVTTFRSTIRDVHHRIRLNTGAVAKTQKNYFDKFVRGSPFHVDQLVWLYWPRPLLRQQKTKTPTSLVRTLAYHQVPVLPCRCDTKSENI